MAMLDIGEPAFDGSAVARGPVKFQGLVAGAGHADQSDQGQHQVLAADRTGRACRVRTTRMVAAP